MNVQRVNVEHSKMINQNVHTTHTHTHHRPRKLATQSIHTHSERCNKDTTQKLKKIFFFHLHVNRNLKKMKFIVATILSMLVVSHAVEIKETKANEASKKFLQEYAEREVRFRETTTQRDLFYLCI